MKKKNKKNKNYNKKVFYIRIFVLAIILIITIGASFAWLLVERKGEKTNTITVGTLSLKLDDNLTEGIKLQDAYPITDMEGEQTTIYKFVLQNDGNIDSTYDIYLDDISITDGKERINDSDIKFKLTKNNELLKLDSLQVLGQNPKRKLDSGNIESGKTIPYTLQVWLAYNASNDAQGREFNAKLRIETSQIIK